MKFQSLLLFGFGQKTDIFSVLGILAEFFIQTKCYLVQKNQKKILVKKFLLYLQPFFQNSRLKVLVFSYISLLTQLPPLNFQIVNTEKTATDRAKIFSPIFFFRFFHIRLHNTYTRTFFHGCISGYCIFSVLDV